MKWTDNEINFLKENFENKGKKYCSSFLHKSESSIQNKANKLKLYVNRDIVSKNMSKDIINIDDYIEVKNIKISYILGLIWTDGTVGFANNKTKTPVIKHTCVKYDSDIITGIFKELNWRHFYNENKKSIGKNTMSAHWISSRDLGNYLISNNYRSKSLGTTIYKNFNQNCISHFLRGLFDGDGCFVASNYKNDKYMQFSITFSSNFDQEWKFLTDILNDIKVSYTIRICKDKLGKSSQLNINDTLSIYNLCEFMYKDSYGIRLERKYNKYLEFLEYKKKYPNYNKKTF